MNIQIKPELEQIIQAQIATGRYANPEDVISNALKILLEWEKGYQQWVEETRKKVNIAIEQLDRGEGIDGEVVIEQLRDKLRKARDIEVENKKIWGHNKSFIYPRSCSKSLQVRDYQNHLEQ